MDQDAVILLVTWKARLAGSQFVMGVAQGHGLRAAGKHGPKKREGRYSVAKVIEFYVPNNFRRRVRWVSPERRGRVLEFGAANLLAIPTGTGASAGDFPNGTALEKSIVS
jgi:hypothetical protein